MKLTPTASLVVGILALAFGRALATPADVTISGNQTRQTRDCAGGNAAVSGNENRLTLQNCDTVSILGNDNTVRVESSKLISVLGNHNTVTWTTPEGGTAPRVSNVGTDNRIRKAVAGTGEANSSASVARSAERPAAGQARASAGNGAPFVINQDGKTLTHDCRGGPAVVAGNRNKLKLLNCAAIAVNGNFNVVDATTVQNLSVQGNDNSVTWHAAADGNEPAVSNVGNRNKVIRR